MLMGEQEPQEQGGYDWLTVARDAFTSSTSYMDANWRKTWERNIALFQSRHPEGSKYNSAAWKSRSRLFRPKTRSMVRKNEAAAAAAFFANVDVVSVEPENPTDQAQVISSELMQELLNYRLQKTIPWFKLLVGAIQDAQVMGIVASYQYWKYREKTSVTYQPVLDDMGQPLMSPNGQPYAQEVPQTEVIEDEPCIELLPLENLRFDPGANWIDPVKSSPYIIRMVPMYVDEVRQMMRTDDPKTGQPKWKEYNDGEIRQAMADYDTLRQARENKRQDPKADNNAALKDFEIVWCHENFVRMEGEEYVYWTLGTLHMLTDPVPLKQAYFTGERPFVIGCGVIEAHKAVPDALVSLGAELQKEANETVNQRRDNVSLVLNKRWIVKRNAQVDVDALMRNVAGGAVMANDPDSDIRELNWPDVTGSAYQEQDRLNVDFDELTGNFSQSSIMTNRQLNETVGGMSMLRGGAGQMTEYLIRTFVETWVELVLRQLVKLEQAYETDLTILGVAGQRAQLQQKYGVDQVTDDMLNASLTVRVNVGMGSTDPQTKLGKLMGAIQAYATAAQALQGADLAALRKEIFGAAGYRDGSRFFQQNQNEQQLMQQIQQLDGVIQNMQAHIAQLEQDNQAKMVSAQADADLKEAQTVKTLTEAAFLPSQQLQAKATNVG